MTTIDINNFRTDATSNKGINKEWALCGYYGIERTKHDHTPYNVGSDIETGALNISVKSPKASLMSGNYGIGCKTFEGIWRRYRKNVHSDTFAFVTNEYIAYIMSLDEFSKFIHQFGYLTRESQSNGGHLKIAILGESKRMREWLEQRAA